MKNFHQEIPKARVNITLAIEAHGSKNTVELPLNVLVLGNFSANNDIRRVGLQDKIKMTGHNFSSVMARVSPKLCLTLPNRLAKTDSHLNVVLTFKSLKDFHPDNIVQRVPEMKKLLAIRNLLKELRSNLGDNYRFRKKLETLVKEPISLQALNKALSPLARDDL